MEDSPSWEADSCSAGQETPWHYGMEDFITMFKKRRHLGYNAEQSDKNQPTFRRNKLPPSSWLNKPSMKSVWKQVAGSVLVSCSVYFSTLTMWVICFSETSVDFQQTTGRYTPKDRSLHNHRYENLISYMSLDPTANQMNLVHTLLKSILILPSLLCLGVFPLTLSV
jgi:hypothetical protein